ncbi:MAG: DEAD/DEAH box helicase, partial [Microthrixaceae bacterium]
DEERREYEALSRKVDDLAENLRQAGIESSRAFSMQRQQDELGDLARSYVAATSRRKDFLYKARDRSRVAAGIVAAAMSESTRRVLLFHERVDEAAELHARLQELLPDVSVALEHSRLSDAERKEALAAFRSGASPVLVSVKSLIEGIDVPEADVGVSVASSSSVRQRIQALGRVLRRSFGEDPAEPKVAEMHVLYVAGTADELIYAKEDWGDLTGDAENTYWLWPADPTEERIRQDGPPATPRPTEEQEWERLGERAPSEPVEWHGSFNGQEYSVDVRGNVRNLSKEVIANPQGVADMVAAVRGRPGGKFRVTPVHRLVLIAGDGRTRSGLWVAGQLDEPFRIRDEPDAATAAAVDVSTLQPGDRYPGPGDDDGGRFKIAARRGGVIERKVGRETLYAETSSTEHPELAANATRLLAAWKDGVGQGLMITVNSLWHAFYESEGERRFLADVPGGFLWPE